MKAAAGAVGGFFLALILVVVMMMGPTTSSPAGAACIPGGALAGVPNGWGKDIEAAAKVAGVPASVLAAQLEAESGWNPSAKSPVGATGLGQFMPGTWARWGEGKDPLDPRAAIAAQGRFMGELFKQATALAGRIGGEPIRYALAGYNAGYNAGFGAVQQYQGIPPFPETQTYVTKILASASTKYAAHDPGKGIDAVAACGGVAAGAGDDLPWKNAPSWVQAGVGPSSTSPLGMYNRECTDFALWRVNQQLGSTDAPFKALNGSFRGDGVVLGSANTPPGEGGPFSWKTGWDVKGWPTGVEPRPGAVVWYAPGIGGADAEYGHVAVVKSVNSDGTYVEEGYNGDPPPNDHRYYTRTIRNNVPSAFLYVPDQKGLGSGS